MTLLVLEFRQPESNITDLSQSLLAMTPRLYIYLIAFYSIANHWVVHQRMFRHITSVDTTMVWLTILGLLFITLIPAATAIISTGWFLSIFLGYLNVYAAYASWILLPNLVAVWGNYKRRLLVKP